MTKGWLHGCGYNHVNVPQGVRHVLPLLQDPPPQVLQPPQGPLLPRPAGVERREDEAPVLLLLLPQHALLSLFPEILRDETIIYNLSVFREILRDER